MKTNETHIVNHSERLARKIRLQETWCAWMTFWFWSLLAVALALILACFAGCATGADRGPTKFETRFFSIQTNWQPVVHVIRDTNVVTVTQTVQQVITTTNGITQTNVVTELRQQTNIVTVVQTNAAPSYIYTPNDTAKSIGTAAGTAAAPFGWGGLVTTGIAGLFGLWAQLRSSKRNATAQVLAQVIETGSELMKTTPQGAQLADKWKTWMIQHQAEEGVIEQVSQIVATVVDNESAQSAARHLTELAQQVRQG